MPKIQPTSSEVNWSIDEGVIGIVGVAPFATLEFMKILYDLIPATKDWHYPRVLIDMNTKIPSSGRYLELNENSPAPAIFETIKELASNGADCAIVPCNTAHLFFADWANNTPIPVISIVDAVMNELNKYKTSKIAVFGSLSTEKKGLYSEPYIANGGEVYYLMNTEQVNVSRAIAEVKLQGFISQSCLNFLETDLINLKRKGVEGIVLGCTELSGLVNLCTKYMNIVVDSNHALATSTLNFVRSIR